MAIVARVSALDEQARQVLRAASIGGLALDLTLIAALAELPPERVEKVIDRLEQARFVNYDGERFAFAAPILAEVVRTECMNRGQRQRLEKVAIELLAARTDLESRVLRAELRARAEPGPEALQEAMAVAQDALANGSDRTARRAIYAADRAAHHGGDEVGPAIRQLHERLESKPR
jgi:hypothetical protein